MYLYVSRSIANVEGARSRIDSDNVVGRDIGCRYRNHSHHSLGVVEVENGLETYRQDDHADYHVRLAHCSFHSFTPFCLLLYVYRRPSNGDFDGPSPARSDGNLIGGTDEIGSLGNPRSYRPYSLSSN